MEHSNAKNCFSMRKKDSKKDNKKDSKKDKYKLYKKEKERIKIILLLQWLFFHPYKVPRPQGL